VLLFIDTDNTAIYLKHMKEKHVPVHGNSSTVLKSVVVKSNNYYFDIQNCRNFYSLEIPWNKKKKNLS